MGWAGSGRWAISPLTITATAWGFSTEVDKGVAAYGEKTREGSWNPEHKGEWFRRALRKAGADVWYGVLGQGVVMDGQKVIGVVVLTPHGRGVVLTKTVVDSTGNADIAAAGGAVCRYTDDTDVAVQGTAFRRVIWARNTSTPTTPSWMTPISSTSGGCW